MRGSAVQVRLVALLASQPHLRPNSRIVGYATVVAVTLAVLLFGWRFYTYTQLARDHVWVHFSGSGDLIGSLQPDDPVAIQGVDVGQVEEITSDTTGVRAKVRFWKRQKIYRDAQAFNVGNGLMGMRYILLRSGTDTLPPLDRNQDVPGMFQPGIAEVMSGIKEVVAKVIEIQSWTDAQANGAPGKKPLHANVLSTLSKTDSVLSKIDRILVQSKSLGPSLRSGSALARHLADSLKRMEPQLMGALASADTVLLQARDLISRTRGVARDADTLARKAAAPLEPLTRDDSLLRKVEHTLKVVDMLQEFVEGRTSMKTNITIFGDNPSKHGQ